MRRDTEGRRALLSVLQVTSGRNVAARCRVTPQAVSKWVSGWARPGPFAKAVLAESYRIEAALWDVEITGPGCVAWRLAPRRPACLHHSAGIHFP